MPPRLPSNPSMADIHHYLSKAIEKRGTAVEIGWSPPDGMAEYRLKVQCSTKGGDAEWSMYVVASDKASLVWTYVSCDVLLVYNLVMSSCGAAGPAPPQFELHGIGAGRIPKTENTFYRLDSITPPDPSKLSDGRGAAPTNLRNRSPLNGDLAHVQMPTLLQSILMAGMTGCLVVKKGNREAEIYFDGGTPTHAQTDNTVGEETLYELLSWKDGDFHFEPDKRSDAATISQSLDTLLLQGMQLIDNEAYLANAGLRPNSVLGKRHHSLSEKDFDSSISNGSALPLAMQKRFYKAVDGKQTVEQLVSKLHLPRSQWVPLMCNMLRCDLLVLSNGKEGKVVVPILAPKAIDKRAIQNVMMSLRRPDTGMFTYPAFLYFLEQEYFRAYRSASPISIVVFQMRLKNKDSKDQVQEPLPLEAIGEAVRRISRVKRHVDMLAHYETFDYALLLPNTKSQGAEVFCHRVIKALTSQPLILGVDPVNLSLAFGTACIPEDALDLALLLSAAEVAKNTAQLRGKQLLLYRDVK